MNANTKVPSTVPSDLPLEQLQTRYEMWRARFDQYPPMELVLLITRLTRTIALEYPNHTRNRKLMLKKLEAAQDAAVARMS